MGPMIEPYSVERRAKFRQPLPDLRNADAPLSDRFKVGLDFHEADGQEGPPGCVKRPLRPRKASGLRAGRGRTWLHSTDPAAGRFDLDSFFPN
jgi:hypothetical protein